MDPLLKKAHSKADKSLIKAKSLNLYNGIHKIADNYNLDTKLSNNQGEPFKTSITGKPENIDEVVEILTMADPKNIGEVTHHPNETVITYKTKDQVTLKTVLPYFIKKQTSNYLNRLLKATSKQLEKLGSENMRENRFHERRQGPRIEYRNT